MEKHNTFIKIILSLICLFFCSGSFAQEEWLCVNPTKKVYFETIDKEVYCIRIDSTVIENNNTILYPFSDVHKTTENCYSDTSGSWLSKYIVIDSDGNTVFINGNNEQIFIKSQSDLNETWDVFKNEDIKIKGEVSSINKREVLGIEDSVKTISFSVYDLNDIPLEHAYNQIHIEVSKNFGLVKTVNFYYFEHTTSDYYSWFGELNLIGIDEPQIGFQVMNLMEQYFDFQAGDELHIENYSSVFAIYSEKSECIYRYISRNDFEDCIIYSYELTTKRTTNDYYEDLLNDVSILIDTIELKIAKGPLFTSEPNEPYYNDWFLYKVRIVNLPRMITYIVNDGLSYYEDSCLKLTPDASGSIYYYPGLGGPYFYDYDFMGSPNYCELVYYKKGDIEWGIPFDFNNSIQKYQYDNSIKAYPNPVKELLYIETGNYEIESVQIRDITGRILISSGNNSVHVSTLPKGIYFLEVKTKNSQKVFIQKLIK